MKDAPYLLVLLLLVSVVLSVALRVMWRTLDRAPYVRTWSITYGAGAAGFLLNTLFEAHFPHSSTYVLTTGTAPILVSYMLMLGYRQRAGLPLYHGRFLSAIAAVALLMLTTYFALPMAGIQMAIAPFFAAVMFWIAGQAACRKLSGGAERTARTILHMFGGFEFLLGLLALRLGHYGDLRALELFQQVRMFGLPFFYISSGLMGVLVIASDMAARMERLAETDTLTGLLNRRGIERSASTAMQRCSAAGHSFTVVIADLDLFKKINDEYGHGIGDLALQRFSAYLRTSIPDPELLGRLGGEEFILMLENTPEAQGLLLIEEIRAGVSRIPIADLGLTSLTSSFGVSEMRPGDGSLVDMLARADCALYAAKSAGRDCVYSFPARESVSAPGAQRVRKYRGAPLRADWLRNDAG
jgi:diguanylate cyclase (GGDEF)-like protein